MNTTPITDDLQKRSGGKLGTVLKITGIAVLAGFLLLGAAFVLFPDPFIAKFARKPVIEAFARAFPGHSIQLGDIHYSIWTNVLECDTLTLLSADSSTSGGVASLRLGGVAWLGVLWRQEITLKDLGLAMFEARSLAVHFLPSRNEILCDRIWFSIPDSRMEFESVNVFSSLGQEEFFSRSRFRQTWFRTDFPNVRIERFDFPALFRGGGYKAGVITIRDAFAEILVNMDRRYEPGPIPPKMPNEILSTISQRVTVDTINIVNGRLAYAERITVRATPGMISLKKINASIANISNRKDQPDTAIVRAKGVFMNSAPMTLFMALPLGSPDFSFRYSGSLGAMNVSALNAFLVPVERLRITAGRIHAASYAITVVDGKARGSLKIRYDGLRLSMLDKKTGSAKGILNRLASLYARIFVINSKNRRDDDGVLALGHIRYRRDKEDYYLQYIWFALRTGVFDIVGL